MRIEDGALIIFIVSTFENLNFGLGLSPLPKKTTELLILVEAPQRFILVNINWLRCWFIRCCFITGKDLYLQPCSVQSWSSQSPYPPPWKYFYLTPKRVASVVGNPQRSSNSLLPVNHDFWKCLVLVRTYTFWKE